MKKIVSLLVVISVMMLSFVTAFAEIGESVTTGVNVVATEDANGVITVTATGNYAKDVVSYAMRFNLSGVKVIKSASDTTEIGSTVADIQGAVVVNSDLSSWAVANSGATYKSGSEFRFTVGDTALAGAAFANKEVFTFYLLKTADEYSISFWETNAKKSTVTYADKATVTTNKNADMFGLKINPYKAPVVEETVWTAEAPADTAEFDAAFKFKALDATEKTEYAGKKLVIFGKGTPAGSLAAGDYKVVIGANEYVGQVPATEYWAIVIVDENGVKVARDSYAYKAFVNGAEAFSGVVNAQ